jgi:hypothetical protein
MPRIHPGSSCREGQGQRRALQNAAIALSVYVAGLLLFFRAQFVSDLDLVFGDRGDARLVSFLHEHVYRWLAGHAVLLSPPFFFDQTRTLGYTDAFLVNQAIYAPLRLLGIEPLLALSLIAVLTSPVAYFFLYLLLRRMDVSAVTAAIAAFIFTFANNLFVKAVHLQHFAVYYLPLVAYCSLLAATDLHRRPVRSCLLGAFAAGLYGLLFSTGYYMAWFFGLGLLIFAPVAALHAWPQLWAWWAAGPRRALGLAVTAGLSLLAALSGFAAIYLPVLATGAGRSFGEYLHYAPRPNDLINVGMDNIIWSGLIRSLGLISDERLGFHEVAIALTPTVQVLLLSSALLAFHPRFWPRDPHGRVSRALVIAGAGVCVLFYLLTIKIGRFSPFRGLYALVPGATAIRVGYRGMVVANLFAVIAIGLTVDQAVRLCLREPDAFLRRAGATAVTAVFLLAAIEQVNLSRQANLSRQFERRHLAAVGSAPRECRSFYVAPQTGRAPYEVQIDAMILSLVEHRPTINGYSGLSPPGWDFYDTTTLDYEQRARRWAASRGIADGLCRIDVTTGTWTLVDVERDPAGRPSGSAR